jgi:hypothetical protein
MQWANCKSGSFKYCLRSSKHRKKLNTKQYKAFEKCLSRRKTSKMLSLMVKSLQFATEIARNFKNFKNIPTVPSTTKVYIHVINVLMMRLLNMVAMFRCSRIKIQKLENLTLRTVQRLKDYGIWRLIGITDVVHWSEFHNNELTLCCYYQTSNWKHWWMRLSTV